MPSTKIIKRRIASVKSTQHIMKAMDLVAASKLQKSKERLDAVRPMFNEVKRVMDDVRGSADKPENIYVLRRKVKNAAYIVITSDRGLCGGYNVNVSKVALDLIKSNKAEGANEKIICVGNKGLDYFKRRKKNIVHRYPGVSDSLTYKDAENIVKIIQPMYISGEVDEIYVIYTRFASMMSHIPCTEKILPVGSPSTDKTYKGPEMSYEPGINRFMENAIPLYLKAFLYGVMAEATVCEHAARMMSMDSASNNASEIIDKLTLVYNRERQAIITQELNEIVGGANALS